MSSTNRYTLLEKLGAGGMGEVFLSRVQGALGVNRFVAVKRVSSDAWGQSMLVDEARLAVKLTHPHIVQVFELVKEASSLYLCMEYVHGQDLRAIFGRLAETGARLPEDCALYIIAQLARALDYAHHMKDSSDRSLEIVHRDVTPANILVSYQGDVKLTDFGIARAASFLRMERTKTGSLKGTVRYMSPEQAHGMRPRGGRQVTADDGSVWHRRSDHPPVPMPTAVPEG